MQFCGACFCAQYSGKVRLLFLRWGMFLAARMCRPALGPGLHKTRKLMNGHFRNWNPGDWSTPLGKLALWEGLVHSACRGSYAQPWDLPFAGLAKSMDAGSRQKEDLMQASEVMAAFVYNAATPTELFPRRPLPENLTRRSGSTKQ